MFSIKRDSVTSPPCVVDRGQLDSKTKRSLHCFVAKATGEKKVISIALINLNGSDKEVIFITDSILNYIGQVFYDLSSSFRCIEIWCVASLYCNE